MKSLVRPICGGLLITCAMAAETAPTPNLRHLMKDVVATQTQAIWDVTNNALDGNGDPDPTKLKPEDWARLAAAAVKVKAAAQDLATAPQVLAAAPGEKLEGEGGTSGGFSAKQVQQAIDASPKAFQAFAQQLNGSMDEIIAAAKTRNAKRVFDVSNRLDQECEHCHKQFWYPDLASQR